MSSKSRRNPYLSVVCALGLAACWGIGCHNVAPPAGNAQVVTNGTPPPPPPQPPSEANTAPTQLSPSFDGEKAYASLKRQCDFGTRPLGSEAHERTKDFLLAEMKKYADQTLTQEFTYHKMPVTNIIGVFNPAGSTRPSPNPVVLMSHWDTRPISDGPNSEETRKGVVFRYGPNGWKPLSPIPGADDGASGTAILLELARLFKEKRPPVGVLLLLDDGEDYGDFRANNDKGDGTELGSQYFAKHYKENKTFGQPAFGILLDMVGASNAFFPRESFSEQFAKLIDDKVFGTAVSLGYDKVFRNDLPIQSVGDDHLAINDAGIPMIDIIHPLPGGADYQNSGYQYWHTLHDTPDKCSAKMLKIVGQVTAEVIYREQP